MSAVYFLLWVMLYVLASTSVWKLATKSSLSTASKAKKIVIRSSLSYGVIASLELGIWNETFHNPDPAPGYICQCESCMPTLKSWEDWEA